MATTTRTPYTRTTCCIAVHRQGWSIARDLTILIGPADRAADLQRLGERMASQNGQVGEITYEAASTYAQNQPHTLYGLAGELAPTDLDWLGLPGPHHDQVQQTTTYIPRRVERCLLATVAALAGMDTEDAA